MPPQPRYALFLQPHYDDVALSCGGTAAAWAAAGHTPQIVTIFASELVDSMVGKFAAWKHSRWNIKNADAVHAVRRYEDRCAAEALGCGTRWLGLPDAIYRGERYASDVSLYGDLHPEEHALVGHLAEELVQLPEWRAGTQLFVPLAAGNHVDHQLTFEAGRRLAEQGIEVWAYEDLPYGIHSPESVQVRLRDHSSLLGPAEQVYILATLTAKVDAIAAYKTQLPVIFRFTDDYGAAVRTHSLQVGRGIPAERFWRVRG